MGSNPTTSAKQPPSLSVGNTDGGFPYVLTHNATLASILTSDAAPKHKLIQEDQQHPHSHSGCRRRETRTRNPETHPMCVLTSAPKRNKIHYMEKQLEQPSEQLRDTASNNRNYVVSLHQQLVEHRKQHGPSMEEMEERTGWSVEKLESFEHYDANPTLNDVARYATALEVRIQDIHKP